MDEEMSALYMSVILNMLVYKGETMAPEIKDFLGGVIMDFEDYTEEEKETVLTFANETLRTKDIMKLYH